MDVVLLQDVENVGLKGDVVSVARGYARNYLLPRRLAEPATPGRLAELKRHEELRARHEAQTVEQARDIATTLGSTELRFDVKAGPTGSLFGSVTATDIADELWQARRVRVDRRKIRLDEPIKRIGRYDVPIELFADVSIELRTLVVPEGGELPPEDQVEADDGGVPEPEAEAAEPQAEALEPEVEPAEPEADAAVAIDEAMDDVPDAAPSEDVGAEPVEEPA